MNKKTILAAITLSAIVATPAFAQKNNETDNNKRERAAAQMHGKRGAEAPNPFDGLDLTADQQAKIKALKEECMAKHKAQAEQRKQAKKNRQEGACKARSEQLAKIKEILTPEQYVKFLENNFTNGCHKMGQMNKMKKQGKMNGNHKRRARNDAPRGQRPAPRPQAQN